MDAAYDSPLIKARSESLWYIPLIDENPRNKERKAEIKKEQKRRPIAAYTSAEDPCYVSNPVTPPISLTQPQA
jgi:hypothetical protein